MAQAALSSGLRFRQRDETGPSPEGIPSHSVRRDPFDWRAPALHEVSWAHVFHASPAFRHRFSLLNVSFVDARPDGHVATAMRYSD